MYSTAILGDTLPMYNALSYFSWIKYINNEQITVLSEFGDIEKWLP